MMNSIINYKARGKIVRGITTDEEVIYGGDKDEYTKSFFEQLYNTRSIDKKSTVIEYLTTHEILLEQ